MNKIQCECTKIVLHDRASKTIIFNIEKTDGSEHETVFEAGARHTFFPPFFNYLKRSRTGSMHALLSFDSDFFPSEGSQDLRPLLGLSFTTRKPDYDCIYCEKKLLPDHFYFDLANYIVFSNDFDSDVYKFMKQTFGDDLFIRAA